MNRVAFDLIDTSQDSYILHKEFSQFVLMASAHRGVRYRQFPVDSTLKRHFFGKDGKHKLLYAEFEAFLEGLQREVLMTEFLEYSR